MVTRLSTLPRRIFNGVFCRRSINVFKVRRRNLRVNNFLSRVMRRCALMRRRLGRVVFLVTTIMFITFSNLLFSRCLRIFLRRIRASLRSRFLAGRENFRRDVLLIRIPCIVERRIIGGQTSIRRLHLYLYIGVNQGETNARVRNQDNGRFLSNTKMARQLLELFISVIIRGLTNRIARRSKNHVNSQLSFIRRVIRQIISMLSGANNRQASIGRMVKIGRGGIKGMIVLLIRARVRRIRQRVFEGRIFRMRRITIVSSFNVISSSRQINFTINHYGGLHIIPTNRQDPCMQSIQRTYALVQAIKIKGF